MTRCGRVRAIRVSGQPFLIAAALITCIIVLGPMGVASAAGPEPLWETCQTGSEAGQCLVPHGVAADPSSGHVFVVDTGNARVDEFTAWGEFLRAWGWDVVASGPDNDVTPPDDQFEICVAGDDVCKAGVEGDGSGQFVAAQGAAVDSGGNLYVTDYATRRVQKFDSEGNFLLMFGGKVNKTKVEASAPSQEQNICPVAPGDVCQAGVEGTGEGEFGAWAVPGDFIATGPTGQVWVGDVARIQRFDVNGAYQGQIDVPGETIQSLTTDIAGNLYATYLNGGPLSGASKANIHKFTPAGEPVGPTFQVDNPHAVAVDVDGNVYTFGPIQTGDGGTSSPLDPISKFDASGKLIEEFGKGEFDVSTGLATNFCKDSPHPGSLYVANTSLTNSFLRAYSNDTPPLGCELPPLRPPQIVEQYALSADPDGALVQARINPHFIDDATYFVEYGTGDCAAGGCEQQAPLSPAAIGGKRTGKAIRSVFLPGLSPGMTYRFRFVAKSSGGGPEYGLRPKGEEEVEGAATPEAGLDGTFTTPPPRTPAKIDCPNQEFRNGPSAFLPDCRAFEMVSPIDKNGSGIDLIAFSGGSHHAFDQSAEDGNGLTYSSRQAFDNAEGGPYVGQYLSRRDAKEGWATVPAVPPHESFPGSDRLAFDTEFKAFSKDLTQSWLIHQAGPPLDPPCSPENSPVLYHRDNEAGSYEALHCKPNLPVKAEGSIELLGVSADGCRTVFRSNSQLTADAAPAGGPEGPYQLYESSCEGPTSPEGPLRFIGNLPATQGGGPCLSDSTVGSPVFALPGSPIPTDVNWGRSRAVWHAFSADGHRLYWSCGSSLYLRTDPDLNAVGDEEVVKVADPVGKEPIEPPIFQTASSDGTRMLFTNGGPAGPVLFAYDATSEKKQKSATIASGLAVGGHPRLSIMGASEDATRAYLVSEKALTTAPNSEGDVAKAGDPNLYFQEGSKFTFVGALSVDDVKQFSATQSPIHPLPSRRASRVSPDGLHAAFISSAPLTGYDNRDAVNGKADMEVFAFDATANGGAGGLDCVSCNPVGARPIGREISRIDNGTLVNTDDSVWAAAWIPGWQTQLYQSRPLSEDGTRLFFNSFESLVTRDTNNRQDVYEWEKAGSAKECEEIGAEVYVASAGGCLSLISSGQDPEDSEFVDASKDGSDVFIRTGESLLSQDPGLTDIYDARVEGGFPPPTEPKPPCEGEACQSPPPPPAFGTPSSSAYVGPKNPKPRKPHKSCGKGRHKVRRKGKVHCAKGKRGAQRGARQKHGRAAR